MRRSFIVPLTDLERGMLEFLAALLADRERVVMDDVKAATGLDNEQLLTLYEPLIEQRLVLLCLNISGGPNWFEITPRGREALRTDGDDRE